MIVLWLLTGASLVVAFVAWRQARRTARRLEQLSQMYWELKYQHGELRVQWQRVAGELPASAEPPAPIARPNDSFIPLISLKR
ncbi:MAG: hypothetical protein EXQ59_00610 [Acidobacteria bacterium]|nr:hypothetical protein [Acidobacteriota bacterium]